MISRSPTEEIITREELRRLLESNPHPTAFDAILPSGSMHLGLVLGVFKAQDIIAAGCKFIVFVADWHARAFGQYDGDMTTIRACGEYHKAAWSSLGLTSEKVRFVFASEIYDSEYWTRVLEIGRAMSVARAVRCLPIMGRVLSPEELQLAVYTLIPMQIADIFHLQADICSMAIDQRRISIAARDVAGELGLAKPVLVHRPLLFALTAGRRTEEDLDEFVAHKMSKSLPQEALFVHDSPEIIRAKINSAYCPPKNVSENALIQICEYILMRDDRKLEIERAGQHGGDLVIENAAELKELYRAGKLHPADLKSAVAKGLIEFLEPCRKYFETEERNYMLKQLAHADYR